MNRGLQAGLLFGLALGAVGCDSGEASVALIFPNEEVIGAVRRIQIQVFPPSTSGGAASDRDCRDFEDLAREGNNPLGTPTRGDFPCPETDGVCPDQWFDGLELQKIEPGRQIVYVLAYASTESDATPILDGCTDRFDGTGGGDESNNVPIELQLVVPDSARLVKAGGDRQVGRSGEAAAVPLQVRVEADSPGSGGATYVIPGVPIRFTSQTSGYTLDGGGDRVDTFTAQAGLAQVGVQLPVTAGAGRVTARSDVLADRVPEDRAEVDFSLSVTAPVSVTASEVLPPDGVPALDVALGRLDNGEPRDLVVLGCSGGGPDGCTAGTDAQAPFGQPSLRVAFDVGAAPRVAMVRGELGIVPAAVEVGDFEPEPGVDEIALVNSRRTDCQDRVCTNQEICKCFDAAPGDPCPCEGSEVRIFAENGGEVVLRSRHTMTASNAIGAATYRSSGQAYVGLAVAGQGRSAFFDRRPCGNRNQCFSYLPEDNPSCAAGIWEACGCPPEEACEDRPGGMAVCVARDKFVDLLEVRDTSDQLYNRGGCQDVDIECRKDLEDESSCRCNDSDLRGNLCTGRDGCNCRTPERIHIGSANAAGRPFGIASGAMSSEQNWDLVAPSIGGMDFIKNLSGAETFEWELTPIINVPVEVAVVANMDELAEAERGPNVADDVVWFARSACSEGINFEERCPLWRQDIRVEPKGCLGVYFTDGAESLFRLGSASPGGCRRHLLEQPPDGLCVGDFNGDSSLDVAVAAIGEPEVLIFAGDGRGGLLDPPERFALPSGGGGGPLVCGNLGDDPSDRTDEIIVADGITGAVYLLRTGS